MLCSTGKWRYKWFLSLCWVVGLVGGTVELVLSSSTAAHLFAFPQELHWRSLSYCSSHTTLSLRFRGSFLSPVMLSCFALVSTMLSSQHESHLHNAEDVKNSISSTKSFVLFFSFFELLYDCNWNFRRNLQPHAANRAITLALYSAILTH